MQLEKATRSSISKREFTLPSWWMRLAPGKPSSFWVRVEDLRATSGVSRSDHSGMQFIIGSQLKGVRHERKQRHQR